MREVKRRAKVGEKIKIVEAFFSMGIYKNGDVFTVSEVPDNEDGYEHRVRVEDFEQPFILESEYVVLEGENEMRFKVGDKARVREGLSGGDFYDGLYFAPDMKELCGKEIEIDRVCGDNSYGVRRSAYHFNDAMLEPISFTLSDLKPCMVVKYRCGELGIVSIMKGGALVSNIENGWNAFNTTSEDFKNTMTHEYDIMEVYGFSEYGYDANKIATKGREILFKCEEPKSKRKMTIAEICEELGEEIEIVKGE